MKGTDRIIAHIRRDAEIRTDEIVKKAEQDSAAIRERYEMLAREKYSEKIRTGVSDCQARLESMKRLSLMESRKGVLSQKQALVEESFDRALDTLTQLPEEEYRALLIRLAAEAAGAGGGELVFSESDRALHGRAVLEGANEKLGREALSLSDETGSFKGGFILRSGSMEVNCSLELILDMKKEELSSRIARMLFD